MLTPAGLKLLAWPSTDSGTRSRCVGADFAHRHRSRSERTGARAAGGRRALASQGRYLTASIRSSTATISEGSAAAHYALWRASPDRRPAIVNVFVDGQRQGSSGFDDKAPRLAVVRADGLAPKPTRCWHRCRSSTAENARSASASIAMLQLDCLVLSTDRRRIPCR